jgi:hypothetical protein
MKWIPRLLSLACAGAIAWPVTAFAAPHRPDLDAPAVPGEFIIQFKRGTPAAERETAVRAHGGRLFDHLEGLDLEAAEFPALRGKANPTAAAALIDALQNSPAVERVEPNYLYELFWRPNDTYADLGLGNSGSVDYQWNLDRIQAFNAWDVTQGSSSVVIAIIDMGIKLDHPDLSSKLLPGYDFIAPGTPPSNDALSEDHATRVAGIAGAATNNGMGIAGVCPNCRLLPVRVFDSSGFSTATSISDGIRWAADQGARVLNLSFGGAGASFAINQAVDYAWGKGAFMACAAGNNNSSAYVYPAAIENCFAVAASTKSDGRLTWNGYGSSYGTWVEVAAPGDFLRTTDTNGGYANQSWTSIAAPNVAGLAGLLASQGLTNAQIRDRICATADVTPTTGTEWRCGRINAARAVGAGATGSGLQGQYFNDQGLSASALKVTRTDATVNFDWGFGSPDPSIGDVFSVRWTGKVQAATTGTHTFFTVADDGVRLWVNGILLIDKWYPHNPLEDSAALSLTAGQKYDVKLEFYDAGGAAQARLLWQPPGGVKEPIPQSRLSPPSSRACGAMSAGESLSPGQSVPACNGLARLAHQTDGNVVLYRNSDGAALWHTWTAGQPSATLRMQDDGNFVLYSASGLALWNSGTHNNPGARLAVQDDCNLVIYNAAGAPIWYTGTRCN